MVDHNERVSWFEAVNSPLTFLKLDKHPARGLDKLLSVISHNYRGWKYHIYQGSYNIY